MVTMRQPWKWIAVLAIVLPLGGYVAGSVVGSADPADDRPTIIVDQGAETDPGPAPGTDPEPTEQKPTARPDDEDDDQVNDDDNVDDQRKPKVVRPAPDRFDSHDDDDDDDDDDRDDDDDDD